MNNSNYEYQTIPLQPDKEGEVVATLISHKRSKEFSQAVLLIHGYVDYFFQDHVAEYIINQGFGFYALDLRKYGRSLLPHQTPNMVWKISEYFEEIGIAVKQIKQDHDYLILMGHSTGGLTAPLFVAEAPEGNLVDALALNSPFFQMNYPKILRKTAIPFLAWVGRKLPKINIALKLSKLYGKSLHKTYMGDWDYNLDWKPIEGYDIPAGWVNAIFQAQKRLRKGLYLNIPTLVIHSERSVNHIFKWNDDMHYADAVLDVSSMRKFAPRISKKLKRVEIDGAKHDVFLSKDPIRQKALAVLGAWLKSLKKEAV